MHTFDDRYLKEGERRARLAGEASEGRALDQEFSDIAASWQATEQERRLIVAAKKGDKRAFAELVQPRWSKLAATCSGYVGQNEADDLAQDAFIKVWERLEEFDAARRFDPWLFRIATNLCLDRLKKRKRAGQIYSIDELIGDDDGGSTLHSMLPPQVEKLSPEDRITLKDARLKCWPRLSEGEQAALLFTFVWEGTLKDLGEMMGAEKVEPGDTDKASKRKKKSAYDKGKYYVTKALKNLAEYLRSEGFDLTSSQLLKLLEEQGTEGDDLA